MTRVGRGVSFYECTPDRPPVRKSPAPITSPLPHCPAQARTVGVSCRPAPTGAGPAANVRVGSREGAALPLGWPAGSARSGRRGADGVGRPGRQGRRSHPAGTPVGALDGRDGQPPATQPVTAERLAAILRMWGVRLAHRHERRGPTVRGAASNGG
jgi:hypothetical protein